MGNNGYGRDTVLLEKMIKTGKLLKINESDSYITRLIKSKLNKIIIEDKIETRNYNGRRYIYHTAWRSKINTVTKINKLRQQNWFWDYFKLE